MDRAFCGVVEFSGEGVDVFIGVGCKVLEEKVRVWGHLRLLGLRVWCASAGGRGFVCEGGLWIVQCSRGGRCWIVRVQWGVEEWVARMVNFRVVGVC